MKNPKAIFGIFKLNVGYLFIILVLLTFSNSFSQELYNAETKRSSFTPPIIKLSSSVEDSTGNNSIRGEERGKLYFKVENLGTGIAQDVTILLNTNSLYDIVPSDTAIIVGHILAKESMTRDIYISAKNYISDTIYYIPIRIVEKTGYYSYNDTVKISTRKRGESKIQLNHIKIDNSIDTNLILTTKEIPQINRDDTTSIDISLLNLGDGIAHNVLISVMMQNSGSRFSHFLDTCNIFINDFNPNQMVHIKNRLLVDTQYESDTLQYWIRVNIPRLEKIAEFLSPIYSLKFKINSVTESKKRRGLMYLKNGISTKAIELLSPIADSVKVDSIYYHLGDLFLKDQDSAGAVLNFKKAAYLGNQKAIEWLQNNTKPKTVVVALYQKMIPGLFETYNSQVGLGIAGIYQRGEYKDNGNKFYDVLKSYKSITSKFNLYPYSSIESIKKNLDLGNINILDSRFLSKLTELSIQYLIKWELLNSQATELKLEFINTLDGQTVLVQEFRNSENSTALKDMVKFLQTDYLPKYKNEERLVFPKKE